MCSNYVMYLGNAVQPGGTRFTIRVVNGIRVIEVRVYELVLYVYVL